ncbi:MAG TPA: helix-turn-helix domain-containing protein [Acidimicrobiales bacterium]|nr:helix-turn-helix domain-containing protein [Acidimicrobiales bacterium]
MPTGVHLTDARGLLFDAAERVLARNGASGLTSRAVTAEAGVAKGVMHRHFADFDAFLAELVLDRAAQLAAPAAALHAAAGSGSVVGNLTEALGAVFTPLAVAMVALVITRDGLRGRLRDVGAPRFPLVAQGSAMITSYLAAEQALGRVAATADVASLSHTLVGSLHLLYSDQESGPPDAPALRKLVAAVIEGGGVAAAPRRAADPTEATTGVRETRPALMGGEA